MGVEGWGVGILMDWSSDAARQDRNASSSGRDLEINLDSTAKSQKKTRKLDFLAVWILSGSDSYEKTCHVMLLLTFSCCGQPLGFFFFLREKDKGHLNHSNGKSFKQRMRHVKLQGLCWCMCDTLRKKINVCLCMCLCQHACVCMNRPSHSGYRLRLSLGPESVQTPSTDSNTLL